MPYALCPPVLTDTGTSSTALSIPSPPAARLSLPPPERDTPPLSPQSAGPPASSHYPHTSCVSICTFVPVKPSKLSTCPHTSCVSAPCTKYIRGSVAPAASVFFLFFILIFYFFSACPRHAQSISSGLSRQLRQHLYFYTNKSMSTEYLSPKTRET